MSIKSDIEVIISKSIEEGQLTQPNMAEALTAYIQQKLITTSINKLLTAIKLACQGCYYEDYDSPAGSLAVEIEELIEKWRNK